MQKITAMLERSHSLRPVLKVVVTELNGKPANKNTVSILGTVNVRNKNAKICRKHFRRTMARLYI